MAILETKALTRCFNGHTAVDALTIGVEGGEVFGLLGPNGAGKTTTIKMLTTLLPPTSGTASVAGFDIVRQAREVRRVIGYVPQLVSADGNLTGYENLLIFAKLYDLPRGERDARMGEMLDLVGLADAADRMVHEYSGGMIRRLEIAQVHVAPAAVALPGRTDRRTRSSGPPGRLGPYRAITPRIRHHHPDDYSPHGGSRSPVPPGGDHASGPGGCHRHARGPQSVVGRQRDHPG